MRLRVRAQCIDSNDWVIGYIYTLDFEHTDRINLARNKNGKTEHELFLVRTETAERSTGKVDKEGTEIFENDVLELDEPRDGINNNTTFCGQVYWDNELCKFRVCGYFGTMIPWHLSKIVEVKH